MLVSTLDVSNNAAARRVHGPLDSTLTSKAAEVEAQRGLLCWLGENLRSGTCVPLPRRMQAVRCTLHQSTLEFAALPRRSERKQHNAACPSRIGRH